jgi:hypothetical protein
MLKADPFVNRVEKIAPYVATGATPLGGPAKAMCMKPSTPRPPMNGAAANRSNRLILPNSIEELCPSR